MKYILGNWKMNNALPLAKTLASRTMPDNAKVILFPPFTSLSSVQKELSGSQVSFGAQDCSPEKEGAFTGDISATMLREAGCSYVILGHSERRTLHGESSALVKRKALAAMAMGLTPVICTGESIAERDSGNYLEIISNQIKESLPSLNHTGDFLIAYEPVWAIGSGKTPTTAQITEVHKTIASLLYRDTSGAGNSSARTAILYGGSVKGTNAREILASEGVDGVLVGSASLKAEEFNAIIEGAA